MMQNCMETLRLFYTIDEKTGEKRFTNVEDRTLVVNRYYLEISRFHGLNEDGISSVIKTFDSEQECIKWINNLYFYEFPGSHNSKAFGDEATIDNLCNVSFAIDLEDPTLAEYSAHYNKEDDFCIVLAVEKKACKEN